MVLSLIARGRYTRLAKVLALPLVGNGALARPNLCTVSTVGRLEL